MNQYIPDLWVILRVSVNGNLHAHRVLASWHGGFEEGESWRMNSGIVRAEQTGDVFFFHGRSGSTYVCHKSAYGMSSYTESVYLGWVRDMRGTEISVRTLTEQEVAALDWVPAPELQ